MGLFDLNRNNKLDGDELLLLTGAILGMDDEDEAEEDLEEQKQDALDTLDIWGLDYDELLDMDEEVRDNLLIEEGLDPADFEILFKDL